MPPDNVNGDVPINTIQKNFKGTVSFISVDNKATNWYESGFPDFIAGVDFDLAHAGKGPSEGWFFFSCYNSEQANTLLEVNASQKTKTLFLLLTGKSRGIPAQGKAQKVTTKYAHNVYDEKSHSATSTIETEVNVLDAKALADMCYFIPCPKSPHGCDVDPNGEYIVGSGKLAALIPVFSFAKLQTAIAAKDFEGNYDGIPV